MSGDNVVVTTTIVIIIIITWVHWLFRAGLGLDSIMWVIAVHHPSS